MSFRSKHLAALSTNGVIFWDVAPCSPVEVDRRFRGTYTMFRLQCQAQKLNNFYAFDPSEKKKSVELSADMWTDAAVRTEHVIYCPGFMT